MAADLNNVEWTWKVRRTTVHRTSGGLNNVVKKLYWSLDAEYFVGKEQYMETYSSEVELETPDTDSNNFQSIDSLNHETLQTWLLSKYSDAEIAEIKARLVNQINKRCDSTYSRSF